LEDRIKESEETATIPRIAGGYNPVRLPTQVSKKSNTWDVSLSLEKGVSLPNTDPLPPDDNVAVTAERNMPVAFVRNSITIWFNTLEDEKSDLQYKGPRGSAYSEGSTYHHTISQKAQWKKGECSKYVKLSDRNLWLTEQSNYIIRSTIQSRR
jgi:hypothetical protein